MESKIGRFQKCEKNNSIRKTNKQKSEGTDPFNVRCTSEKGEYRKKPFCFNFLVDPRGSQFDHGENKRKPIGQGGHGGIITSYIMRIWIASEQCMLARII